MNDKQGAFLMGVINESHYLLREIDTAIKQQSYDNIVLLVFKFLQILQVTTIKPIEPSNNGFDYIDNRLQSHDFMELLRAVTNLIMRICHDDIIYMYLIEKFEEIPESELLTLYRNITLLEIKTNQIISPAGKNSRLGGKQKGANAEEMRRKRCHNIAKYIENLDKPALTALIKDRKTAFNELVKQDFNYCREKQPKIYKQYRNFKELEESQKTKNGVNLSRINEIAKLRGFILGQLYHATGEHAGYGHEQFECIGWLLDECKKKWFDKNFW